MRKLAALGGVLFVATLPLTLGVAGLAGGVALAGSLGAKILLGAAGAYLGGGTGYVIAQNTPFMVGTAPTSVTQEAKTVLKFPVKVANKGAGLAKSGLKYVFNGQARKSYNAQMSVYKAEKKRLKKIANGPKGQPSWEEWGKARGELFSLKKPKL